MCEALAYGRVTVIPRILDWPDRRPSELSGILKEEQQGTVIVSCGDEVEGAEIARVLGGRVRLADKGGGGGNEAYPLVVPDTALHEAKEVRVDKRRNWYLKYPSGSHSWYELGPAD
jgi:hypothetical protein